MLEVIVYFSFIMQLNITDNKILLRRGHSNTAVFLAPGLIEVTVFGGCPQFDLIRSFEDEPKLAATTIMTFGKSATTA